MHFCLQVVFFHEWPLNVDILKKKKETFFKLVKTKTTPNSPYRTIQGKSNVCTDTHSRSQEPTKEEVSDSAWLLPL